ncbi:MAG: hypothetical protein QM817_13450 [Archangium sp.]
MLRSIAVLVVCLWSCAVFAEEEPLLRIKGTVHVAGGKKAPLDTTMYLSPLQARTAVVVKPDGAFELQAIAARTYTVTVTASGHAPVEKQLEVDERGQGDLGAVVLTPLKKVALSLVFAHHAGLSKVAVQRLEVLAGKCVVVRANDDSGCRSQFCVTQRGETLVLQRPNSGRFEGLGKATMSELLSNMSPSSTIVDEPWNAELEVSAGDGAILHHEDPFCRGLVRVDAIR